LYTKESVICSAYWPGLPVYINEKCREILRKGTRLAIQIRFLIVNVYMP